jgi:hypothetical protein
MIKKIITHNGGAHLDDLLACSFLVAKYPGTPVVRKESPSEQDLDDNDIFVIDFGKQWVPEKKNFDHHQIKGGSVCAFTQVLEFFNARDYNAIPWIKWVETWDHEGPAKSFELINAKNPNQDIIANPVESAFIKEFSKQSEIKYGSFCYSVLTQIGVEILSQLNDFYVKLNDLEQHAKILEINGYLIADMRDCDFAKLKNPSNSKAESYWQKSLEKQTDIILTYDRKSPFRMIRRTQSISFSNSEGQENIDFVHQNGFLIAFKEEKTIKEIIDRI